MRETALSFISWINISSLRHFTACSGAKSCPTAMTAGNTPQWPLYPRGPGQGSCPSVPRHWRRLRRTGYSRGAARHVRHELNCPS